MTAITAKTTNTRSITSLDYQSFISYLDVTDKSRNTYITGIKKLAEYLTGNGITSPTRADILAYKKYLADTYKPTTAQLYIVCCKMFFSWLDLMGYYDNVAEHIKGVKLDREHKKDCLNTDQVKHIISTITNKRDKALFVLMVACGLRTSEVAKANVEDLRQAGNKTVLQIQGKGKTEKADFVIIPPLVENAIREYLADRNSDSNALFESRSNHTNGRITAVSISRIIKGIMQRAGYNSDRLTAHSLRHTAVTLALLNGQKLEAVQQFARHANVNTTMIYVHTLDKLENDCSSTIADSLK